MYDMKQVKELKVVECNTNSDCPSYSNGCYFSNSYDSVEKGYCNIYYLCHDDGSKCYILNKEEYEENEKEINTVPFNYPFYTIKNETQEQRILTTCARKNIVDKKCMTEFCFRHNDCFSNHCYLGDCETDKNNKAYICSLFSLQDNESIKNEAYYKVECKLAKQEPCTLNSECFTNICDDLSLLCIDSREEGQLPENDKDGTVLGLPIVLFILISMLLTIFFCIYCCCFRTPKSRHEHSVRLND